MNQEKYIGMDVHQATISVAVMDSKGDLKKPDLYVVICRAPKLGRIIPPMKAIACALLGLLTASAAFPQQVGLVDLTRPIGVLAVPDQSARQLPPGCTEEKRGIMADGIVKLDDNRPRNISLQIIKLSSETLEVSGDGRAEVRLQNTGEQPISIPLSTDWSAIQKASSPDHLEWEEGSFQVVLRDKRNHTIALTSNDWSLYGSRLVSGSLMTIKPGEWITAFLNFKVLDRYQIVSPASFRLAKRDCFWNGRRPAEYGIVKTAFGIHCRATTEATTSKSVPQQQFESTGPVQAKARIGIVCFSIDGKSITLKAPAYGRTEGAKLC
jgi:hypothetical protein